MNKKLLTAAIAAVIAAPTAALANDVTVYGAAHVSIDYLNEFDESWQGAVLVFDGNGNPFFTPAIRFTNAAGTQFQNMNEISENGVVLYRAPTLADMARYQSFLDGLRGDRNDGFDVASRASRIGFKGTEDLANGLKAIWKMEFQIDIADRGGTCSPGFDPIYSLGSPTLNQGDVNGNCDNGGLVTARNAYVGLAGGWGTFLVGRHDTPFKMSTGKLDLFADTLADYNSTIGFVDIRTNSAIAYVSPSWSGLSFAGALVAPHVYSFNNTVFTDSAGNGFISSQKADADGLAEAYSLALTYDNAGFFASVAYEVIGSEWWDAYLPTGGATSVVMTPYLQDLGLTNVWGAFNNPAYVYTSDDSTKWRVGLGWTGAGFTVGGLYEWEDNVLGADGAEGERWQIQAGYTFGNNMIKAMYGQGNFDVSQRLVEGGVPAGVAPFVGAYDEESDQSAWAVGLDHNFSKRTKAYILYTAVSGDSKSSATLADDVGPFYGVAQKRDYDAGGFSIGMIHTF
jgi:predicted porin